MALKKRKKGNALQPGETQGLHRYFGASKHVPAAPGTAVAKQATTSGAAMSSSKNCAEPSSIGMRKRSTITREEIKTAPTPNPARVKNSVHSHGVFDGIATGVADGNGPAQPQKINIDKRQPTMHVGKAAKRKHDEVDETDNSAVDSKTFHIRTNLGDCNSVSSGKVTLPLERKASPIDFSYDGMAFSTQVREPKSRFETFGRVPWLQYHRLYATRLKKLREHVLAQAQALWSSEIPSNRFLQKIGTKCSFSCRDVVVIGVTFKDFKTRANIVQEYRSSKVCSSFTEGSLSCERNRCCENDDLWLEDSSSRIQLELPVAQIAKIASGLVVAVRGYQTKDYKFHVKSLCLAQAQDAIGIYEILHDGTWVNRGVANDSPHVATPLAKGTIVSVVEIRSFLDADRVRGRIEEPEGWISLVQPSTGYCWAKRAPNIFGAGVYEIMHEGTWINCEVANNSPHATTPLRKGLLVNVVEIRACRDVDRIRARIENPRGWISLSQPSTDYCWARKASIAIPSRYLAPALVSGRGRFLALLSGIFIGDAQEDVYARNNAMQFLLGNCTNDAQWHLSKEVQHVIVCGGVYGFSRPGEVPHGLADVDEIFAELAGKMPVHILPGHTDPTNLNMPQMPLHPYFFRLARNCQKFKSVTNPYENNIDGMQILGHAGQAVQDLLRCTSMATPLEALTFCLDARLLAPTAPDTLATQSFDKEDPFVIDRIPQILFSGGHKRAEYAWRVSSAPGSGTMCICVPAFNQCPAVVFVNLRDPRHVLVKEFSSKAHSTVVAR